MKDNYDPQGEKTYPKWEHVDIVQYKTKSNVLINIYI